MQRVYRSRTDRILGGVCGGIGVAFDVDPNLVRLGWIVLTIVSLGIGLVLYLAAWILLPEEPASS